jgi:NAD-dependent deacetylase
VSEIPEELVRKLQVARHVVVLTGAGISAESGLPTFRDPLTGLWAQYRPEELGTPEAFRRNPRLVWEWFAWRRQLVLDAQPNAGHRALVALEQRMPKFTLLTQNVDSLHQRAGSRAVVELHGSLRRTRCFDNNHIVEGWPEADPGPPPCPICPSLLRPDVVWFGENLPEEALVMAYVAAHDCDLYFSIGTSGTVQPAASFRLWAWQSGATVVTINPEVAEAPSEQHVILRGKSGEVLPALLRAAWPQEP